MSFWDHTTKLNYSKINGFRLLSSKTNLNNVSKTDFVQTTFEERGKLSA